MKALLTLIFDHIFEFLIFSSIVGGIITGAIALYSEHQLSKTAMENGYIQKVENNKTIWVKENAN